MHDHGNCARCDALEADLTAMRGAIKSAIAESNTLTEVSWKLAKYTKD